MDNKKFFMELVCLILLFFLLLAGCEEKTGIGKKSSVVAPDAKPEKLAGGFGFTEGPVADGAGNVYFTDIPNTY